MSVFLVLAGPTLWACQICRSYTDAMTGVARPKLTHYLELFILDISSWSLSDALSRTTLLRRQPCSNQAKQRLLWTHCSICL
ncbi:hypothetical protein BD626DRAFT_509386, partial [Schizophyllum amplum]